jgi:hypothetical protein
MRVVTLEEHFAIPMVQAGAAAPVSGNEDLPTVIRNVGGKIADLGEERIADMDRNGITVQVLTPTLSRARRRRLIRANSTMRSPRKSQSGRTGLRLSHILPSAFLTPRPMSLSAPSPCMDSKAL